MTTGYRAEDALASAARRARDAHALASPALESAAERPTGDASAAPAFDDEVLVWALASSSCGGLDACCGAEAG